MLYILQNLTNALKPKARFVGIEGSFNWGNKLVDQLVDYLSGLKVDFFLPFLVIGSPTENDLVDVDNLADFIIGKYPILFAK